MYNLYKNFNTFSGAEIFDVETYYTCQNKNFSIDSNEIYIK